MKSETRTRILAWVSGAALGAGAMVLWLHVAPPRARDEPGIVQSNIPAAPASAPRTRDAMTARPESAPAPESASIRRESGSAPVPADSCIIYGVVTDASGSPVAPCDVMFHSGQPAYTVARTAPDGSYSIYGLGPATWDAKCRAEGFTDGAKKVTLDLRTPILRVDFQLNRQLFVLIRYVTPEGAPLAKAIEERGIEFPRRLEIACVVTLDPPPASFPETPQRYYTNSRGNFRRALDPFAGKDPIPEGVDGRLEVLAPPPVYVSAVMRNQVLATARLEKLQKQLDLAISPDALLAQFGRVRLRWVDAETGELVRKGTARVGDRQSSGIPATVGEGGAIEFSSVMPGLCVLSCLPTEPYASFEQYIRVAPGQELDLGDVKLYKSVEVSGTFVDAAGAPVEASARLLLEDRAGFPSPRETGRMVTSDASGKFQFRVPPGRHVLTVVPQEGESNYSATTVDATAGNVTGLKITVTRGTAVTLGYVVPEPRAFIVVLLDGAGAVVDARHVSRTFMRTVFLAPGAYKVIIYENDKAIRELSLQVGTEPVEMKISDR